jgi:hypothetical protein
VYAAAADATDTYLLLADQDRVDVLLVTWLEFDEHPD